VSTPGRILCGMATEGTPATAGGAAPANTAPAAAPAGETKPGATAPTSALGGAPTGANVSTPPAAGAPGEKPAGEQPGGEGAKPPAPAADVELKVPEGFAADEKVLGDYKALAKEFGLDSAKAQKGLDFFANLQRAAVEQRRTQAEQTHAKWVEQLQSDKEFGGADFQKNQGIAFKAVQKFAPELIPFFNQTGLGDHPELFRAFFRVGKAMQEDTISGSAPGAGAPGADSSWMLEMYDHPTSAALHKKE
jgi:hypothetical protein